MSLATPEKIRTLQRKLYRKAKAEPAFRFYLLYDKIYREDILRHAYALARANAGAPGTDQMSFAAIEALGLERWLAGCARNWFRRRTGPIRCGECPYRSRTEASDRSAFQRSGIGWSGPDCRQARAGTDLRGGLRGQCLRLPPRSRSGGRGRGSAPADLPGLFRRRRRRFIPLLRLDST